MNRRIVLVSFSVVCWAALVVPASAQHFKQISTGSLARVAAGRGEVWGLNASDQIYRFNSSTKQFLQIPGSLTQIAVGGGTLLQADEVWGVNASDQIYRFNFSTKTFVKYRVPLHKSPSVKATRTSAIPMKSGESMLLSRSTDITIASPSLSKSRVLSHISRSAEATSGGSIALLRSTTSPSARNSSSKLEVPCNKSQLA